MRHKVSVVVGALVLAGGVASVAPGPAAASTATAAAVPAAPAAPAAAGQCDVQPFAYAVSAARPLNGKHRYTATGTSTLRGDHCRWNGKSVRIKETSTVRVSGNRLEGSHTSTWDVGGDGRIDARWRGTISGINDQTPADWNEVVDARSASGEQLRLEQHIVFATGTARTPGRIVTMALDAGFTIADD